MSANFTVLLLAAGLVLTAGAAALFTVRGIRREMAALRREMAAFTVPAPRAAATGAGAVPDAGADAGTVPGAAAGAERVAALSVLDIRTAVAEALADERERELAEARAFWAEQEARDGIGEAGHPAVDGFAGDAPAYGPPPPLPYLPYLPQQADFAGLEPLLEPTLDAAMDVPLDPALEAALDGGGTRAPDAGTEAAAPAGTESEPAAGHGAGAAAGTGNGSGSGAGNDTDPVPGAEAVARLLEPESPKAPHPAPGTIPHPSGPDFAPKPVVASPDQTADRLSDLADARIPLSDVRPGPLGTLDVYVFADGTTLCMTPGHRETALRLSDALDRGEEPVLRGGSAIAGAYALTFAFGDESVYVLADRVVASL